MPHATVSKSELKGSIDPPPSLELACRCIWAASLGDGGAYGNCPNHPDIKSIISVAEQLGANIEFQKGTADIFGSQEPKQIPQILCNNSSRASRLCLPLALTFSTITSLKDISIPSPATAWLDEAANQLGIRITKTQGEISISGPPSKNWLELSNRAGAYWLEGFMFAIPQLDTTEYMLQLDDFISMHPSFSYTREAYRIFEIGYYYDEQSRVLTLPAFQFYNSQYMDIPPSWKEASYYMGAFLLCGQGEVKVPNYSHQPEKDFWLIFHVIKSISASEDGNSHHVRTSLPLRLPKQLDPRPYPSLIPLMVLLATQAQEPVEIAPLYPLSPLARKRLLLSCRELEKIGAKISMASSQIIISPSKLIGGKADSHGDSRIAMALVLAGLICKNPLHIEGVDAINKANKNFLSDLKLLGAKIKYPHLKVGVFS
ncbi:MAG: hypothetical protein V1822_00720 [Candidatus Micrarchaeota archaeon]